MNRTFSIIFIVLAVALVGYNVTLIDFKNPFEGDSVIAFIGILASLCAVVLVLIYRTSKKIQQKIGEK